MRFLICLRGDRLSRPTLHFAALMASRLSTDMTVLFVAPGVRREFTQEADLAREKMNEWAIDSPGMGVIKAARDHLESLGLISSEDNGNAYPDILEPGAGGALELRMAGRDGEHVAFRFRQGDALEQILEEMKTHRYDLLVIGAGARHSYLVDRLLQFSTSSVLVVKNPLDIRYKVLVATDASPAAHRAELLAIKTASFLKMELKFLTVVRNDEEREFMKKHLERMNNLCELKHVPCSAVTAEGNIVKEIIKAAGDDHIAFIGRSRHGALKKLVFGSKAIKIINGGNCPIVFMK
ncbi:MAG TPA: universal stress protein [Acidobacteriota bacterium]|nr:universal stress protein [Acidobacteriota bacterium]